MHISFSSNNNEIMNAKEYGLYKFSNKWGLHNRKNKNKKDCNKLSHMMFRRTNTVIWHIGINFVMKNTDNNCFSKSRAISFAKNKKIHKKTIFLIFLFCPMLRPGLASWNKNRLRPKRFLCRTLREGKLKYATKDNKKTSEFKKKNSEKRSNKNKMNKELKN